MEKNFEYFNEFCETADNAFKDLTNNIEYSYAYGYFNITMTKEPTISLNMGMLRNWYDDCLMTNIKISRFEEISIEPISQSTLVIKAQILHN